MASLDIKLLAGAESKAFLVDLEKLVTRMERAIGKSEEAAEETSEPEFDTADDEENDFAPAAKKTKSKKAAAAAFDDEDAEEEETEEEEEEQPKKSTKAKKAPVYTSDDVNEACKERSKKKGHKEVFAILKKKFNVERVSELDPKRFAECIAAMRA